MTLFYPSYCAIDLIACAENIIFMVHHVGEKARTLRFLGCVRSSSAVYLPSLLIEQEAGGQFSDVYFK